MAMELMPQRPHLQGHNSLLASSTFVVLHTPAMLVMPFVNCLARATPDLDAIYNSHCPFLSCHSILVTSSCVLLQMFVAGPLGPFVCTFFIAAQAAWGLVRRFETAHTQQLDCTDAALLSSLPSYVGVSFASCCHSPRRMQQAKLGRWERNGKHPQSSPLSREQVPEGYTASTGSLPWLARQVNQQTVKPAPLLQLGCTTAFCTGKQTRLRKARISRQRCHSHLLC